MTRYVPPNRRPNGPSMDIRNLPDSGAAWTTSYDSGTTYSQDEIHRHFWPEAGKNAARSPILNSTEAHPDSVGYITMRLKDQERWESKGVIAVDMGLQIVPGYKEKVAESWGKGQGTGETEAKVTGDSQDTKDATEHQSQGIAKSMKKVDIAGQNGDGAQGVQEGEKKASGDTANKDDQKVQAADQTNQQQTDAPNAATDSESHVPAVQANNPGPIEYTPATHDPIALFATRGHAQLGYRFLGWFAIAKVAIFRGAPDEGGEQPGRVRNFAFVKLDRMAETDGNCPAAPVIDKIKPVRRSRTPVPEEESVVEAAGPSGVSEAVEEGDASKKEDVSIVEENGDGSPRRN